jgi:hypothetical protein
VSPFRVRLEIEDRDQMFSTSMHEIKTGKKD